MVAGRSSRAGVLNLETELGAHPSFPHQPCILGVASSVSFLSRRVGETSSTFT